MFEPLTLTLSELSIRWNFTTRQVFECAQGPMLPLYFNFEGLVIGISDTWHLHGGAQHEIKELENYDRYIASAELTLKRHKAGKLVDEFEELSSEDVQDLYSNMVAYKHQRTILAERLQLREKERLQFRFRGHLRVAPRTLWDIEKQGVADFPIMAFYPGKPVKITTLSDGNSHDGEKILDGDLMCLEPMPGQTGKQKEILLAEDLFAILTEVKAFEEYMKTMQYISQAPALNSNNAKTIDTSALLTTSPIKEDPSQTLAALFDPVTATILEKMFPAGGKWKNWTEHAKDNGLIAARQGRAKFNPYKASLWFLTKNINGWDLARCYRVLANNLPPRSRDNGHLFAMDID